MNTDSFENMYIDNLLNLLTDFLNGTMKLILKPDEIATINVHYNPLKKGRISCDVKLSIDDNPYEYFIVKSLICPF